MQTGAKNWRPGAVKRLRADSATARTITLEVRNWSGHVAGQYLDVRTTAGPKRSMRSYAVASAADGPVELTVQELGQAGLSSYLVRQLRIGDHLEVCGPLGERFTWRPGAGEPVQLIAEGAGIVPLASILRTRRVQQDRTPMRLLYVVSDPAALLFAHELDGLLRWARGKGARGAPGLNTNVVQPPGLLSPDLLEVHTWPSSVVPTVYVSGSRAFVVRAVRRLIDLGHDSTRIRTQDFGPAASPPGLRNGWPTRS